MIHILEIEENTPVKAVIGILLSNIFMKTSADPFADLLSKITDAR